jgi:hypothetical protein
MVNSTIWTANVTAPTTANLTGRALLDPSRREKRPAM